MLRLGGSVAYLSGCNFFFSVFFCNFTVIPRLLAVMLFAILSAALTVWHSFRASAQIWMTSSTTFGPSSIVLFGGWRGWIQREGGWAARSATLPARGEMVRAA